MSKTTKYPSYSGGSVSINGNKTTTVKKSGNSVNVNYNMSDNEKKMYNSLQSNLADTMQNLFEISDTERTQWQNQLDALQKQGIENINSIYDPMQTDLQNDVAARFGNLDNSIFLDKLKKITNNKAQAVADLSNNLAQEQNNLYTQELQNRMNLISMMNSLANSFDNKMIQYMNLAKNNSSSGNQYNQQWYNNNSQNDWFNQYQKIYQQNSQLAGTIAKLMM